MCRRAFARHRTGSALLLGLSLRAPNASAERAEPDEARVGTVEGKAAEELPSAIETPPIPAAPIVAPRLIRDEAATLADGSFALPTPRGGTATVHVESSRHLAQQTNDQRVPGDEARGAPPGNAGYFLDGVRVPYLYHVGLDPSVLHPGSIDRVDLHLGGYPARFGRFAGGVVSAQTRGLDPASSGEAKWRLLDLGGLIEPTFARGRGSPLPALLSLLIPEMKRDDFDYQARATYEPSARDRFSTFGFGSYEPLREERNGILTRLGDAFRPKITITW